MDWTQERVEALFHNVEENQHLDFKNGKFLKKDCQDALTKQITGFANSDGGVLIIGVEEGRDEQKHLAVGFAPCDGVEWSKERLETLIDSNISPRVRGLKVTPIRLEGDIRRSVYVVEVPKSGTCHQSSDSRYYFRLNFSTEPMKDFQIRDVMNRRHSPVLTVVIHKYKNKIRVNLVNIGTGIAQNWAAVLLIPIVGVTVAAVTRGHIKLTCVLNLGFSDKNIQEPYQSFLRERNVRIETSCLMLPGRDAILPGGGLLLCEFEYDEFDPEKFTLYWMVDTNDSNRRSGIINTDSFMEFLNDQIEEPGRFTEFDYDTQAPIQVD